MNGEEVTPSKNDKIFKWPQLAQNDGSTDGTLKDMIEDGDNFINSADSEKINTNKLQKLTGNIYNILLEIGVGLSVIIGLILGIKFMLAGVEEKAEVKKMLLVYVIGCIITFGSFGIWKMVVEFTNSNIVSESKPSDEEKNQDEKEEGKETETKPDSSGGTNQGTSNPTIEANKITLSETSITLQAGKTKQLKATIEPSNTTNKNITWRSTNTKVAKVDSNGKVTAVGKGKAAIVAKTSNEKNAACLVTVKVLSNKKISKTLNSSDFTKVVDVTPKDNSIQSAQSFCVTEKYYVCALVNSGQNNKTAIQVYNKSTGKLVNTVYNNFYHANGMTYNSKNQKIYVAHMDGAKYSVFSAQNIATTNTINKTTKKLSKSISGIAYDEYTGNYYASKGGKVYVYNNKLEYKKSITKSIVHTPQDIGAYRGLILVVDYNKGKNAIDIYRESDSKYLGRYTINLPGELESVQYDETNKNFALYINYGRNNAIYTTTKINLEDYYI